MTGYFVFRQSDKKRAYFYLVAGLILGFAMGWAQMMRGAHFLSHNLWTAWVIWLVNVGFYLFNYKKFKPASLKPQS
jgi:membrane-associated PAP2 superfamily phosphatase